MSGSRDKADAGRDAGLCPVMTRRRPVARVKTSAISLPLGTLESNSTLPSYQFRGEMLKPVSIDNDA